MKQPENGINLQPTRRAVLQGTLATAVAVAAPSGLSAMEWKPEDGRPAPADRKFSSPAIESAIAQVQRKIADPTLRTMVAQCFPNTLDTTVFPETYDGKPSTYVITGDIDAMWLRDSSAQMWPYLPFVKEDKALASLFEGLVRHQARLVLLDPYANAFLHHKTDKPLSWSLHDDTDMKPGVGERKWEVDSLCYTIRIAHGYWKHSGATTPFDAEWKKAAWKIIETFTVQQRFDGRGPYHFMRPSMISTDTVPLGGYGNPARPVGMIFSMFRPSDDSCIYPLFVPANLFAVRSLLQLEELARHAAGDEKLAEAAGKLAAQVKAATEQYGRVQHDKHGEIWAYEVDGYGNKLRMDDANAPGLLSLAYLECCDLNDPLYQRTRSFVLSEDNPYFFKGTAAEGVGGPHVGLGQVWPMSIIMRALTSTDDKEIAMCLKWLRDTTAGTNFMHESFDKDDPKKFTRTWFAWANGLFGELIFKLAQERPALLREQI
ncbi:MAG: glycoside hydrolase family 125 protein [Acidobacteriota bacterium]|nr:glycoside hydrolase family 125 protein [Acidobacteriota bacterium]